MFMHQQFFNKLLHQDFPYLKTRIPQFHWKVISNYKVVSFHFNAVIRIFYTLLNLLGIGFLD